MSSSDQLNSEDSGSVPASLLEEQIRQRSSIVFNIDEDDYLVRDIYVKKIFLSFLILCQIRGGWTAVCKDSREQFRLITIEESRLAADRVTQSFDHE